MASEKSKYAIQPIMEIPQSFLGMANDYQKLIEELKNSKETILKQEIQLTAASETIRQQETQLVKAKAFYSHVDQLEGYSRSSIDKLKEELEIERRARIAAEEKVQELGEQIEKLNYLTKIEVDSRISKEKNIFDTFYNNSMETDVIDCNPVNFGAVLRKFKESEEKHNYSSVNKNEAENSSSSSNSKFSRNSGKSDKDSLFRTELQIIESNLLKYINKLIAKENKPHKRQKCLSKVIRMTEKMVSCLSTMVSEEFASYTIQTQLTPQSSPTPPPILHSPIQPCKDSSNESTLPPTESINLPSSSTSMIPDVESFTEKTEVRHEVEFHQNNKCICGHESTNEEALLKHINCKAIGKLFKCEMCANRSRDTNALNLHYQRVHRVKSDFANGCGKCGKSFATKGNLRKHLLSHQKSGKGFDVSAIKLRVHH